MGIRGTTSWEYGKKWTDKDIAMMPSV